MPALRTILALVLLLPSAFGAGFSQPDTEHHPEIFSWTDTCNVYVLRDGGAAILINLGDGTILDHLAEIGVQRVDWVLFTDHHREQSQGYAKLTNWNVKVAAPEAERSLFERPASFRKMNVRLGDTFTVHGASYVRPPIQPIRIDRGFSRMDTFRWGTNEFWCADTRGNSPGGMSYLIKLNGQWLAFSGDLMVDGARMNNYFDTEWDYSFASGIYALHNSAALLESFDPALLLPSHGPPIREAKAMLNVYQRKLRRLESVVIRGYSESKFAGGEQDAVSKPTSVPWVWQVTPHLYKFKGPNYYVNFVMLLADSGHALLVDCGLFDEKFLDASIELMKQRLGLKKIDAVLISHMHGDHMLEAPHLRTKFGTPIWALDRMVNPMEHPERFDYAAPIQAYGKGFDSVAVDRILKSGETFQWEGFTLTSDWMPGQTEFAMGLHGTIDGKKVVFTGDNIFGNPRDPAQSGHEAIVARNSGILEDGYIYGAEFLNRLQPDLIMGGHSFVMDQPAAFIQRYRAWAYEIRDVFRSLSTDPDYRYWFDPFWVRAEPYRVKIHHNQSAKIVLHLRNFRDREQKHHIVVHAPEGFEIKPALLEGSIGPRARADMTIEILCLKTAPAGTAIAAFDATLDGHRYGEWFDCILEAD